VRLFSENGHPDPADNTSTTDIPHPGFHRFRIFGSYFHFLFRICQTTVVIIRITTWSFSVSLSLTEKFCWSLFSLSVLEDVSMDTNPALAVPAKELLVFIRILLLLTNRGRIFYPLIFTLLRIFGLLHLYLSILVTARAGSVPAWFRKLLS